MVFCRAALSCMVLYVYLGLRCRGGRFDVTLSTVVQQSASDVFRARILAIYSLAFLGSAPIGALLVGQLAEWVESYTPHLWPGWGWSVYWQCWHYGEEYFVSELSKSTPFRGQDSFSASISTRMWLSSASSHISLPIMKRHPSFDRGYERHGEA